MEEQCRNGLQLCHVLKGSDTVTLPISLVIGKFIPRASRLLARCSDWAPVPTGAG